MNAGALRAALAVFAVGVLAVWLVKPIGNPCPDLGVLPLGSTSSSSPSFAPPLTRTCTYTTEGTQAHKRYVPFVDWLVLAGIAAIVGGAIGLFGPGGSQPGAPRAPREPRRRGAPRRAASRPRGEPRAPRDAPERVREPAPRADTERRR